MLHAPGRIGLQASHRLLLVLDDKTLKIPVSVPIATRQPSEMVKSLHVAYQVLQSISEVGQRYVERGTCLYGAHI